MNKFEVRTRTFPFTNVTDTSGWVIKILREDIPTSKYLEAKDAQQCVLDALRIRDPTACEKQIIHDNENVFSSTFDHANLKGQKWVAFINQNQKQTITNAIIAEILIY